MRSFDIFLALAILSTPALAQKPGPVDKPVATHGHKQEVAYQQAIAPYVAKARASYPAAKKRFLAGLPRGYLFAVETRLYQTDKNRHEDVFVVVEAIKNGNVYGWIANKIGLLTNYKKGQRIHFRESDMINWLILRPDGTEEGNDVGKFLKHWKPPKT